MVDKSVIDGTKKVYDSAEDYIKFADGDVEEDLFSFQRFENYWDYNDIKTWDIIEKHLSKILPRSERPFKVLDVGCGAGAWALRIADTFPGSEVIGVDFSGGQIRRARSLKEKHNFDHRVKFHVADATNLPFEDNEFDASICLHDVLNHIPNYQKAISEIARVTSKVIIASVHGHYGPPTFFAQSKESIVDYEKDGHVVWFKDKDGNEHEVYFRRFTSSDLMEGFSRFTDVLDCLGIDIFCYKSFDGHEMDYAEMFPHFDEVEKQLRREEPFIDFAKHIMIIAKPKN